MRTQIFGMLLFAAVPVAAAVSREPQAPARAVVEVEIDARCTGGENTSVTIRPWNLRVRQGDEVSWVLNRNANSSDISITPKRDNWPFATRPPYRGSKATPARADGMRPNARGRYAYNVSLICTNGARSDTVLVDPDIIVD